MKQFLRFHAFLVNVNETQCEFICRDLTTCSVDLGCRLTDSQGSPLDLTQVMLPAVSVLTVAKDDRYIVNATVYASELPLITERLFSPPMPAALLGPFLDFPQLSQRFSAFRWLPDKHSKFLTLAIAMKEVKMRRANRLLEFEDLNERMEDWTDEVNRLLKVASEINTTLSLEQKYEEVARREGMKAQIFDFQGKEWRGAQQSYDFSVLISPLKMSLILYDKETTNLMPLDVWTQGFKETLPDLVHDLIFDIGAALRLTAPSAHRSVFDLQDSLALLQDFYSFGTRSALPQHYAAVGICTHCGIHGADAMADGNTLCSECRRNSEGAQGSIEMQCGACRGNQELLTFSCRCILCEKCLMHCMIAGHAACDHRDSVLLAVPERLKVLFELRGQREMCAQCEERSGALTLLPCQHVVCSFHERISCNFCRF